MGQVRRISANVHVGIMEGGILIILAAILAIQYYEGYTYTTYSFEIQGIKREPGVTDVIGHSSGLLISCICGMTIPMILAAAKSPFSSGGRNIDKVEMLFILFIFLVAFFFPIRFYYSTVEALSLLKDKGLIDGYQFKFRKTFVLNAIIGNIIGEVLLGLWSIWEIKKHEEQRNQPIVTPPPTNPVPNPN